MKKKKGKRRKKPFKKKSVPPGLEVFSDLRGVGISIAPGMQNVRSGKVLHIYHMHQFYSFPVLSSACQLTSVLTLL